MVGVATDDLEAGLLTDFGSGKDFGDRLSGLGGLVDARPGIEADGLEAFGFELAGELRILLGPRHIHKALEVIVAGVTQRRHDLLHVELLLVALGILAPAKNVRADQGLLRRSALACRRNAASERRYRHAERDR